MASAMLKFRRSRAFAAIALASIAISAAGVQPTNAEQVCRKICNSGMCIQICGDEPLAPKASPALESPPGHGMNIPSVASAVLAGDYGQVEEALKRDPDGVNRPIKAENGERAGYTPIIVAAAFGHDDILALLLKRGAQLGVLDDYHRSALWYAAFQGDERAVRTLLTFEAAREIVNVADEDLQRTPLHFAVRTDNAELTASLLKAGANAELKDWLGRTPRDRCKAIFTGGCKPLD
jgi:hypothetical protein